MSQLIKHVDITNPDQINMSPESLAVCQAYLQCKDTKQMEISIGIPEQDIRQQLMRADVKAYISSAAFAIAERNIDTIQDRFESLIEHKLEEMEESELGSKKDISELLKDKADIEMNLMKLRIKLLETETKREEARMKTQINMQINNNGGEEKGYDKLLKALVESNS